MRIVQLALRRPHTFIVGALYERAVTTTVNDVEHIESQTLSGVSMIKIFGSSGNFGTDRDIGRSAQDRSRHAAKNEGTDERSSVLVWANTFGSPAPNAQVAADGSLFVSAGSPRKP